MSFFFRRRGLNRLSEAGEHLPNDVFANQIYYDDLEIHIHGSFIAYFVLEDT